MRGFLVSYEVMTDESAADGEAAESGIVEEGLTLRDALQLCTTSPGRRWQDCGPCECDSSPLRPGDRVRTLTFWQFEGRESRRYFEQGETSSRALHIPSNVTPASSQRIARLLRAYGTHR